MKTNRLPERWKMCGIVAMMVAATTAQAATITVDDDLSDLPSADHQSIQAAIDAADSGDEIVVYPGTYTSNNHYVIAPDGNATIIRAFGTPEETILDGQNERLVILAATMLNAVSLEGFTLTRGSDNYYGGGTLSALWCQESTLSMTDCIVEGNQSVNGAGALYMEDGTLTLANTSILDNQSSGVYALRSDVNATNCTFSGNAGRGLFCNHSSAELTLCNFTRNTWSVGGGLFLENCNATVISCNITNNNASSSGGGAWVRESNTDWSNCVFSSNRSNTGGGVSFNQGSATLTNCTITENDAQLAGGGIACQDVPVQLIQCTITDNEAGTLGGGLFADTNAYYAITTLTDTLVCGNIPDQASGRWQFASDGCLAYSCIDDDNNGVPDECHSGTDDGVHEVPAEFATIQEAINAAGHGDKILVSPGTYTESGVFVLNPAGKSVIILATGEPNETILDGQGMRRVVYCGANESQDTIIQGFTFTGGLATSGGGLFCMRSSPTITNCTITGNVANFEGGGASCNWHSEPTFDNCVLSSNTATNGGGLYLAYDSPAELDTCIIRNNNAIGSGGGLYVSSSRTTLTDCEISGNNAQGFGGGGFIGGSSNVFDNCTMTGNSANVDGGGLWFSAGSAELTTCNIGFNAAGFRGGGIAMSYSPSTLVMTSCIIQNNISVTGAGIAMDQSNPTMAGCVIEHNTAQSNGGGLHLTDSHPDLYQCIIADNTTLAAGGGAYLYYSDPVFTFCQLWRNTAIERGGAMRFDYAAPSILHCMFAWNESGVGDGGAIDCSEYIAAEAFGNFFCENNPDAFNEACIEWGNNVSWQSCTDCNNNGVDDAEDIDNNWNWDTDNDGMIDFCEYDCDGDGVSDAREIFLGSQIDINGNGWADECECLCDLDSDGAVGVSDLELLVASWGTDDYHADMTGDGVVSVRDLLELISQWGPCEI